MEGTSEVNGNSETVNDSSVQNKAKVPVIVMEGTSEVNENSETVKDSSVQNKAKVPVVVMEGTSGVNENSETVEDSSVQNKAQGSNSSRPHSPVSNATDPPHSHGSHGEESRIDSESHHLVETMEEDEVDKPEVDSHSSSSSRKGSSSTVKKKKPGKTKPISSGNSKKASPLQMNSEASSKSKGKGIAEKPPVQNPKKPNMGVRFAKKQKGTECSPEDSQERGLLLLKQARDLMSSEENSHKALELALRAAKSFEACANENNKLDLVMCLHVTAAIHCSLGQYSEAIPILERSVNIPVFSNGQEHALAKFSGHMQLGDTYAMLGQLENSFTCYRTGLEEQKQALGEKDSRVGETCRYLAEAHVQAFQFKEAEKLCQMALDIHREHGSRASLEEALDRRLMGLICATKGNHEEALEHLVLASMAMVANCQDVEVASVDCSIGDAYLSLTRYDEAVFAYQKALTLFKTTKGENHPSVGSIFARLADVYHKTGKIRDSNSYCENALRIYDNPSPGIPGEEIATGYTEISAIYESMNELEKALELLHKALEIYKDAPGQQSTIAGVEAQIGVMHYMMGDYSESYNFLRSAISKLRASGDKNPSFFGLVINQMGLACVQRYAVNEAVEVFEEARDVLEREYGPHHPETLGVYSNLAGTYDALGRLDKAIDTLEYVVGVREEKLGTAHPDMDDERKRLAELLKDAGRVGEKKVRSLENLLGSKSQSTEDEPAEASKDEIIAESKNEV